jgi:clan AA aspartic protease
MNGRVDDSGRALVRLTAKAGTLSPSLEIEAWVDTGFTGELVLPQFLISRLGLLQSATVSAELGDGSSVTLKTFSCVINWFDREQQIEVVANEGSFPLLGVGLLQEHTLTINYAARTLSIV